MPTNSLAWYVNALAFARLGDIQQFRVSYRQSRITAPNEQWIVEKRVQLAEEMFSELDAQALQDHEQDLTLLANSSRGTRSIARRYASDEHFRKRIVDIVSRLPPERQRAFLNNVRRAIR